MNGIRVGLVIRRLNRVIDKLRISPNGSAFVPVVVMKQIQSYILVYSYYRDGLITLLLNLPHIVPELTGSASNRSR